MRLESSDLGALDEGQKLAVLECLLLAITADNKLTPDEMRRFDEVILELPFGMTREVMIATLKGIQARLLALDTAEQVHAFAAAIASQLPAQELREKIVFTMAALMLSDGELHAHEKNVVGLFTAVFQIPPDRASAIREALLRSSRSG